VKVVTSPPDISNSGSAAVSSKDKRFKYALSPKMHSNGIDE
jgi:hypothetical protein